MMEQCAHLKCHRWNVAGVCYSGRRSRCLRVRLERGEAFPVDHGLHQRDEYAWATEIMRLWKKAGSPALIGGNGPEQINLAKAILGLAAPRGSRLFGVCFSAAMNAALYADERAPRWDLDPPQRESYFTDTEYAFGLRDYAKRLIALNKQERTSHEPM